MTQEERDKKYYLCTNCGFSPTNRADWCDLGCGRDYVDMIDAENLPDILSQRDAAHKREMEELEKRVTLIPVSSPPSGLSERERLSWQDGLDFGIDHVIDLIRNRKT